MIIKAAVLFAIMCFVVALALNLWRLWVGPADSDRILALDTMTMNIVALLVLTGIQEESRMFADAAMLLALFGFIASVAFARVRRGRGPLA